MKNKIKIEIEMEEEDIAMIEADFWVDKGEKGLAVVIERILHEKALSYKRAFPSGVKVAIEEYERRKALK